LQKTNSRDAIREKFKENYYNPRAWQVSYHFDLPNQNAYFIAIRMAELLHCMHRNQKTNIICNNAAKN
jgi:hypothetical protein